MMKPAYRNIFTLLLTQFLLACISPAKAQPAFPNSEIPILCYHNIRADLAGHYPDYTISTAGFRSHMKILADSGYTTILPDQLYNHLTQGSKLPPKSILITFDDSREEQFTLAMPVLDQYGFKAVFFVMNVTINKPGYFTAAQIRQLADSGHCIALHTWDHPDLRKISGNEWQQQLDYPKKQLERITGKPVYYFAYPYGAWNDAAVDSLIAHHVRAAFQLSGKRSITHPLYTIRRLQVSGAWSSSVLLTNIRSAFR